MAQCSRMAISDTLPDRGEQYKRGALFRGIAPQDCEKVLGCLGAQERSYGKGEYIVRRGDNVRCIGFVMDGRIITERTDALGNRSILGSAGAGDVFAEAFAATGMAVDVDVVAAVDSTVTLIDFERILCACPTACSYHSRLVRNLFSALAQRNLALSRKIADVTPRTIRGRLMSYLSTQKARHGDEQGVFTVPYSRQQLADYLCVDRSALSSELNRMKKDGLIDFDHDNFWFVGKDASK